MRLLELAPTAGLRPKLGDLLARRHPGALEQGLGDMLGVPVSVESSGSACLVIAFAALASLSRRRTIIVPAFTCPLVVRAAAQSGLKVLACDTEPGQLDLSAVHLAQLVDADCLCVVATHYGGAMTDVARLRSLLAPDVTIIEDAAQAFGARQNGQWAGLAGDIGIFSFALGKGFTIYEGGGWVAREPRLHEAMATTAQHLRQPRAALQFWISLNFFVYHFLYNGVGLRLIYGPSKNFWLRRGDEVRAIGDYFEPEIPIYAPSTWRRSVGAASLPRLRHHLIRCRANHARVVAALSGIAAVEVAHARAGDEPISTFALVVFDHAAHCTQALDRLWRSPLGVSRLFAHALCDYPWLATSLTPTKTPHAQAFAARCLTIGTSTALTNDALSEIALQIGQAVAKPHA